MTSSRLRVDSSVRTDLFAHAREGADRTPPTEVCGVLAGVSGDGETAPRATAARRVRNVADDPRVAYELDPAAALAAIESIEAAGRDVVGFYHSHPETSARPSRTDRRRATWTGYVYAIVAPSRGELTAWRWTGETFEPLAITVE
ncbi:desampylase [Haloferacaceae archaeon DSL9]